MTLHDRRARELEKLQALKDSAEATAREMQRTVGRIVLLDELINERNQEEPDVPGGG